MIARPSGTEPAFPCYLEVILPVEEGAGGHARARPREHHAEFGAAIGLNKFEAAAAEQHTAAA